MRLLLQETLKWFTWPDYVPFSDGLLSWASTCYHQST